MTGEVERTDDGRHLVVDGRRWRTADPHLPDDVRAPAGRPVASGG